MDGKAEERQPDVLEYLDYRSYLKDWYVAYKRAHPHFSYRVLAGKVGFSSPGFFTQIQQRKSNISLKMAMQFADAIGLHRRERDYFLLLVCYDQEDRPAERRKIFQRMSLYKNSAATLLHPDQGGFLASWRHAVVRELLGIEPFSGGEDAWGNRLIPPCSGEEILASIDLLLRLGLARRTAAGIVRADACIETGKAYSESATLAYMRQVHDLGGDALERFPRKERHHAWATLSISRATFEAMREELRSVVQRFLALAAKDDDPDRVVQINFEVFPLAYRQGRP